MIIKMKQISDDDDFAVTFNFLNKQKYEIVQINNNMILQYYCKSKFFPWYGF